MPLPILIFFGLMVALILWSVIANILNPPQPLEWSELPPEIAQGIHRYFPDIETQTIKWSPAYHKYLIKGQWKQQPCKLEVETTKKGVMRELEYEIQGRSQSIIHLQKILFSELPPQITDTINQFMNEEQRKQFKTYRVAKGKLDDQSAYEIEGRTKGISWEFEIVEDGTLLELEIESKTALPSS